MAKRQIPKWFKENIPSEVSDSSLFKFKILVRKDQVVEVDMRSDLDVDYVNIQQELEESPSVFAYWASIYSELKMQCTKIERQIKTRRGRLVEEIINDATQNGVRLTDKQVGLIIEADEVLNGLETKHMILQKHTGKMWFMVEAIRMKADNLRSLSGFAKMEFSQQQ